MRSQILDQFGRPYELERTPDRETLAVAPIFISNREYVTDGLTPEKLAAIFKEADTGDVRRQAELFEELESKDSHILGEIGKRKNAINEIDFTLTPASDEARDAKVRDFVQEFLEGMTDFDDIKVGCQDAVGKAYGGFEIKWDVSSGQAVPQDLEWIEQQRFRFVDPVTGYLRKTPLLISDANAMGDEIPPWKVLFHRYGGKSGNATRSGVFRVCTWMFLFKNYSIKDWVIFSERYGMPLRIGKYAPGATTDDKRALRLAISQIGTDAAGIISENTKIEFIEAMKGATASDLWEKLASFCNREQSKAVLGMAQSADSKSPGSFASDKVKDMVRLDLLKADTKAVARTIRHQLIRPIVGFNFGWDTPIPGYGPEWEEHEDLKTKAETFDKVVRMGIPVPVSYAKKEFGIPDPEKGEDVLVPLQGAGTQPDLNTKAKVTRRTAKSSSQGGGGQNNANKAKKATRKIQGQLDGFSQAIMDGMIDKIRNLVMTAGSLEEIRDGLIDLYPDMDPEAMGNLMQRALARADLTGRADVMEEGDA